MFSRAWLLHVALSCLAVTCFPAPCCHVFFRAWLLRVFSCLAVSCFPAPGCYVFPAPCCHDFFRAWLLRVFSCLAVSCFPAPGCYVFSDTLLLRVFPCLVVTCFLMLGCYVFSRAFLLSPGQTIPTCQHNMSQNCWAQHVACVWPPCCDMLAVVGSNLTSFKRELTKANMSQDGGQTHATCCRPTMLRHAVLACCDRLARALRVFSCLAVTYGSR